MKRTLSASRLAATLSLAALGSLHSLGQNQPGKLASISPTASNALHAVLVKTGLFLITGGGANTLLRLSANGLVLVDGKFADSYALLLSQVRRINEQPVRFVILTNADPDHIGTNAKFIDAGTQILVNQDSGLALTANDTPRLAGPPIVTFGRDYDLRLGGMEAQLMHFGRAHTGGDTVVYFPNLKVIAVGDLYAASPNPDYSNGGSLVGWSTVLAQIMKLDFDVAVPAHGEPITRADFAAFQTRLETLVSRAIQLVKSGAPKDQFITRLKTDDLGWPLNFTPSQIDGLYAELSQSK